MILSYAAIFGSVVIMGVSHPVLLPGVMVPGIADANGAAASAGLVAGDVITEINGQAVGMGDEATRMVVQTVKESRGRTLHLLVQRAGSDVDEDDARVLQPEPWAV